MANNYYDTSANSSEDGQNLYEDEEEEEVAYEPFSTAKLFQVKEEGQRNMLVCS